MKKNGYTLVELLVCLGFLGVLALAGFGIYALVHLIAKFW